MKARRELDQIRRHYRAYARDFGESVVWFEYLPETTPASAGSTYDDVYDEGGFGAQGRKYKKGVIVPVLMITETEDQKRAIPEGRQPVQLTNFVASIDDFRKAGVSSPFEYQAHLNDMFLYDGRYFSVATYRSRGRLRDDVLVIVEGIEVYISQEMAFDEGPEELRIEDLPWPTSLPTI
jgi:hypothetical protein